MFLIADSGGISVEQIMPEDDKDVTMEDRAGLMRDFGKALREAHARVSAVFVACHLSNSYDEFVAVTGAAIAGWLGERRLRLDRDADNVISVSGVAQPDDVDEAEEIPHLAKEVLRGMQLN